MTDQSNAGDPNSAYSDLPFEPIDGIVNAIAEPSLVVITGLSGAGRTEAMRILEDLGFFCIDNLPPAFLKDLVALAGLQGSTHRRLAVVCDIRAREFFQELLTELALIKEHGVKVSVLFLEATNDVLLARYKQTRRRHPLSSEAATISTAIARERESLSSVRDISDYIIDTSKTDTRELRRQIRNIFSQTSELAALAVTIYSFGFKYGIPMESDVVMDVRFLPNPHYQIELQPLTGLDESVRDYVLGATSTQRFLDSWFGLLDILMPGYVAEGKQLLLLSIGCTGGQHRSVAIAENTGAYLKRLGYTVTVIHRDLPMSYDWSKG